MSNVILDVSAEPVSFPSGATIQLVVEYRSTRDGRLVLSSTSPIQITPSSVPLKAAPNGDEAKASIAIERQDGQSKSLRCDISAEFFDSALDFFIEVA